MFSRSSEIFLLLGDRGAVGAADASPDDAALPINNDGLQREWKAKKSTTLINRSRWTRVGSVWASRTEKGGKGGMHRNTFAAGLVWDGMNCGLLDTRLACYSGQRERLTGPFRVAMVTRTDASGT